MYVVIGPVLRRADTYRFDSSAAGEGTTPSYPYRRIEDAYYARKAAIKALAEDSARAAIVCQTLDEFIARSSGYEMLDDADRACAA